jgi:hypothetical protein
VNQAQVDRGLRFLESDSVTNFEARMAAEVKLYWIIYNNCCGTEVDLEHAKSALQAWQWEWAALFSMNTYSFV